MAKRPTEEDLGIEETAEEKEISSRPVTTVEDDDLPLDGEDHAQQIAAPETAEAKAARERDASGKFVAKPKDEPVVEKPGVVKEAVKPPAPPPGFVDKRALDEARAQNKILEERFGTLMEVVNRRNQQPAETKPAEPPTIPQWDDDPMAAGKWTQQELLALRQEREATARQSQQTQQEQYEFQQALTLAKPQYDEAQAADPTLEPTRAALFESYANEIAILNRMNPDFQRNPREFLSNALTKLEQDHIKFAVASRQNVGDYIRDLAKSRNVQAAAPAAAVVPPPPPKTIAERQAAQARHMSIGDLPGSAAPGTVSAKDLVKMSPKQFAEFAKKMGDDGLDELFRKV